MWGILDTEDNCWIGNNDGPFQHEDEQLARLAAELVGIRMNAPIHRFVHRELPTDCVKIPRDTITPERSLDEALRLKEEGLVP